MFSLIFWWVFIVSLQAEKIFNGTDLQGWQGNFSIWKVEHGVISAEILPNQILKHNEFLFYEKEVSDFELTLEYRIEGPWTNSGIQIRSSKTAKSHAKGYQADLDNGATWLGRIYDEHGRGLIVERGTVTLIGEKGQRDVIPFRTPESFKKVPVQNGWNQYRIVARGNRIETHINGVHFSTLEDYQKNETDLKGLIALQLHSGKGPAKISFRNMHLDEFSDDGVTKVEQDENPVGIIPAEAPNVGFEMSNLHGWVASGDFASGQPVQENLTVKRCKVKSRAEGEYFFGGYEHHLNDQHQGTLESIPFKVTHRWGSFLIGGGSHAETRVEVIDHEIGKVLYQFSGKNSESMQRVFFDLSAFLGKKIKLRLVDQHSGGWGHVNYDDFRFFEKKPKLVLRSPLFKHMVKNPVEESHAMSKSKMPKGFKVETLAKEPDLQQPIAMTFDAKGRIWIAEAMNYPIKAPKGQGRDRLVIFSDENGDGSFETRKVFAENLNLVSGFEIGYGGVWVGAAPELLFIPDRNRDDKPDGPAVVKLDGWDIRDTHETPNSFLWGHDGWLYGNHGVFNNSYVGKPGTPKEKRTLVNAAVWRYHPVKDVFEIYATGGSNQWGLDYNAVGEMFMTHCRSSWGKGPVSQVIRDGYYWNQNNKHNKDFIATAKVGWNRSKDTPLINFMDGIAANGHGEGGAGKPGSKKIFGGHSHVGAMIYLGDNWPESYRHQLYTHNLHGAQMNRLMLEQFDSGRLAYTHGRDQLFVEDNQYLAVDLKYGPDGAVYFIDWHDKQHCHSGKYEIWDRSNGRLNRMQWQATYQPYQQRDLYELPEEQLVDLLDHKNEWFPRMVQHVMRQRALVQPFSDKTKRILKTRLLETSGSNRFRYLVALYGLGDLDDELYAKLLNDPDEHIRAQALTYLTERDRESTAKFIPTFLKMAQQDPSAKVRLILAGATQYRIKTQTKQIIETLAMRPENAADRFIPKMLWFSYVQYARQNFDEALSLARKTKMAMLSDSIRWFVAKYDIDKWLADAIQIQDPIKLSRALDLAHQALRDQQNLSVPTQWKSFVDKLSGHQELKPKLELLQTHWGKAENKVDSLAMTIREGRANFAICAACHMSGKNMPGPSLEEISKVYKNKKDLVTWIKKPGKKRENYMQMPAFEHMDDGSLNAIAEYLLSLKTNKG